MFYLWKRKQHQNNQGLKHMSHFDWRQSCITKFVVGNCKLNNSLVFDVKFIKLVTELSKYYQENCTKKI